MGSTFVLDEIEYFYALYFLFDFYITVAAYIVTPQGRGHYIELERVSLYRESTVIQNFL